MDFELSPPHGVAPLRIGMTLDEVVESVSSWGNPRVIRPAAGRRSTRVSITYQGVGLKIHLEKGERVTAIELWRPSRDREENARVFLAGDEVFYVPAKEILARAVARGWTVNEIDPEMPVVPRVTLSFTRVTLQEVSRESDGLPVFFTSVLVADENYE
jgi:hypothetical protein